VPQVENLEGRVQCPPLSPIQFESSCAKVHCCPTAPP
jgi:hypothetical protein